MKILILGGAGFIGSNFVRHLAITGKKLDNETTSFYRPAIVDKLTYAGKMENLTEALEVGCTFYKADICDYEKIKDILRDSRPNIVVNFAAETHVSRSITNPTEFAKTNVLGVQVVMETIREVCPKTLIIHISTDEVFGQQHEWQAPWTDYSPLNPRSPYAATKASGELIARSYYTTYDMNVIIVRPANTFGPYQYPEKLIPRAVTNILEGKKIPLMGTGKEIRDWLYVEDLCEKLLTIIEECPIGECFNIPGNNLRRNREIVEHILQFPRQLQKNQDNPLLWEDYVEQIPSRLAHDFKYHVAGEGIAKIHFRKKQNHFISQLTSTILWYTDHQEWWKPLKQEAEAGNKNAHNGEKNG